MLVDNNDAYRKKLERERAWHQAHDRPRPSLMRRLLHHPIIFSFDRLHFNHRFPKAQMASVAQRHIDSPIHRLLIAPCGQGADYGYVRNLCQTADGIDLSVSALKKCPADLRVAAGDALTLPYADHAFDLIVSSLFFHHLVAFEFAPFLAEFHRTLRPGGGLVVLEPSLWYPLNLVTRPLKALFDNPFDEVEDEAPFRPGRMMRALEEAGFVNTELRAATFSHCAFFVPVARIINRLSSPFLNVWPFKYLGWLVVFWAEKELGASHL